MRTQAGEYAQRVPMHVHLEIIANSSSLVAWSSSQESPVVSDEPSQRCGNAPIADVSLVRYQHISSRWVKAGERAPGTSKLCRCDDASAGRLRRRPLDRAGG